MSEINWRRINIDQYDPDSFMSAEELLPPVPPVVAADYANLAQLVRGLLSKGDISQALITALENPPYGGDEIVKASHLKTVLEVLTATKSSDITSLVESLSQEQQTTLIKYLYKGMSSILGQSNGNAGILLTWFQKTIDTTGSGPIVRHISDRRTV
ncbi:Arp2/3 complex 16 kDa subunit ARPC5 [Nadsonia fulvescens var. elongata DSM 6958]|uniref:Actin-related protein 2/3 complex subunit 5 n=1 Tax=Nadsonia fulvescens var. elongata DSM 6958 TaxID=857566 RepID=A0A1E3PRJ0_9ASCO|nr:Arp2/3 complex 16 kDa subunit ARPC5 [Nadsonia fulvescens var. elongata DSM 6958]